MRADTPAALPPPPLPGIEDAPPGAGEPQQPPAPGAGSSVVILLIALLVLVVYVRKKLAAHAEHHSDHPDVPRAEFERWRRRELRAGRIGMWSTIGFIAFVTFAAVLPYWHEPPAVMSIIGPICFGFWLLSLVTAFMLGLSATTLRNSLKIVPRSFRPREKP